MKKILVGTAIGLLVLSIVGNLVLFYTKKDSMKKYQQQVAHYDQIVDLSNPIAFENSLYELGKLVKSTVGHVRATIGFGQATWSDTEITFFTETLYQRIDKFHEKMCEKSTDGKTLYGKSITEIDGNITDKTRETIRAMATSKNSNLINLMAVISSGYLGRSSRDDTCTRLKKAR